MRNEAIVFKTSVKQIEMKISQFKVLYTFIIVLLFSVSGLYAQHLNDFFKHRPHKETSVFSMEHVSSYGKSNLLQRRKNHACIEWQKIIGGSGEEDRAAIKIIPGGYITCGSTTSPNGDFHVPLNHDYDAYVAKLDNKGHVVWARTYGGTGYEDFNDILPTPDGGFIAIGSATSDDGDVTGHHGDEDVWLVKLDSEGKIQWQKCYGGIMEDHGNFIVQTPSGYAFCAGAASADGDLKHLSTHGLLDAWIVKISFSGKILFQQTYGGSNDEDANGIYFDASDKTILFESTTLSNDGDVSNNHGDVDTWVVKIDVLGAIIWKKTLGGSAEEETSNLVRTKDGNFVFAGYSNSVDGDVNGNNGLYVAWLVKLNSVQGNIIWNRTFADPAELGALGVLATADGGTVAMGLFGSSSDVQTWDAWVMKSGASGNQEWMKIFGGSNIDFAAFGAEDTYGNIITSNYTESNDGDVRKAAGGSDTWIVLLDKCGDRISNKIEEQRNTKPALINKLNCLPNPLSNSATILFTLSESHRVSFKIYDMNGRLVKTLADKNFEAGEHKIEWNAGATVSQGIYFLKMQSETFVETEKIIVRK